MARGELACCGNSARPPSDYPPVSRPLGTNPDLEDPQSLPRAVDLQVYFYRDSHEVRISVFAGVTPVGGASVTKRREPMMIANQPSFGGFFSLGAPGIYRLRFEARRPGVAEVASAEFEYRVSPEGRR